MEETLDKKNKNSKDTAQENKAVESASSIQDKEANIVSASDLSRTSNPLPEDADIFDQLHYAAERLKAHNKQQEGKSKSGQFAARLNSLWKFEKTAKPRAGTINRDEKSDYSHLQGDGLVTLEALVEILQSSPLAAALLENIEGKNPSLILDDQVLDIALADNKILINPTLTLAEASYLTLQALRRLYLSPQKAEGAHSVLYPLCYEPEDAVLLNRILEADCRAAAIWAAWEMKISGINSVWTHIIFTNERDMARAFEQKAKEDFRNITTGKAMRTAFDTFFGGALMTRYDQRLIQEMLVDEKGLVFSGKYPSMIVTPTLIDFIGELPNQKNYMIGTGDRPLSDSHYAAVKDRSSANFLWFVKFERSFQETEREFAEKEAAERAAAEQNIQTESEDSAEKIIALPIETTGKKAVKKAVKGRVTEQKAKDSNVLYLFGGKPQAGQSAEKSSDDFDFQSVLRHDPGIDGEDS